MANVIAVLGLVYGVVALHMIAASAYRSAGVAFVAMLLCVLGAGYLKISGGDEP